MQYVKLVSMKTAQHKKLNNIENVNWKCYIKERNKEMYVTMWWLYMN